MTDDSTTDDATVQLRMKELRADKAAKRRYTDDDTAPPALRSSGVAHEFWPSRAQFTRWWMYVDQSMGADDEGWWYARCPVHDPTAAGEMSAMVSFKHGMMRCLVEEEACHAGKRGMTLTNAVAAALSRAFPSEDGGDGEPTSESE